MDQTRAGQKRFSGRRGAFLGPVVLLCLLAVTPSAHPLDIQTNYVYDDLYRLTMVTVTADVNGMGHRILYTASYTYDKNGNRTGMAKTPGPLVIDQIIELDRQGDIITFEIKGIGFRLGATITLTLWDGTQVTGVIIELRPDGAIVEFVYSGWDTLPTNPFISVTNPGGSPVDTDVARTEYSLSITISPGAAGSVNMDIPTPYYLNDVVRLSPIENFGYEFTNWSGDTSGTAIPRPITMDANKSVTANFDPYTAIWVDFNWNGFENGSESTPFNTVQEGIDGVNALANPVDRIVFQDGDSSEQLVISTPLKLMVASGATARIGVPEVRSASSVESATEGEETGSTDRNTDLGNLLHRLGSALTGSSDEDEELDSLSQVIYDQTVFEPVLPFTRTEDGEQAAQVDSVLAIRLRSKSDIESNSIWATVPEHLQGDTEVTWQVAGEAGDMHDVWVIFRPMETWYLEDLIELTAVADLLESRSYNFSVETSEEFDARQSVPGQADTPPSMEDNITEDQPISMSPADKRITPVAVESGLDEPLHISPERVYDKPRTVWIPIPEGTNPDDVRLFYYHPYGDDRGWYPAENIQGWLVPDSIEIVVANEMNYIRFSIRHAGIVQLGVPVKDQGGR